MDLFVLSERKSAGISTSTIDGFSSSLKRLLSIPGISIILDNNDAGQGNPISLYFTEFMI
jgi:hypothetical protein